VAVEIDKETGRLSCFNSGTSSCGDFVEIITEDINDEELFRTIGQNI
ncbi:unnamed protein product, partial [Rotaria magnacalcarata]